MAHTHAPAQSFEIPASMRAEHEEIHAALERATQATGRVGEAARALAKVLHPHFVREDQIALHAKSEEEMFYPAAVLVGDIIRARAGGHRSR